MPAPSIPQGTDFNAMYTNFQNNNPNAPVPQRPVSPMAPSPTPMPNLAAQQANDQLSGNVPIPGVPQDPRGGKYEAMARVKHYQEAANTNVANLKPGTLASDRHTINGQNDQRVTNFMGTSLLGGAATQTIAPRIAELPFKAWASARAAFPTFNSGVIAPAVKAVTDYTNAAPKR